MTRGDTLAYLAEGVLGKTGREEYLLLSGSLFESCLILPYLCSSRMDRRSR